jgi:hypothetical protein
MPTMSEVIADDLIWNLIERVYEERERVSVEDLVRAFDKHFRGDPELAELVCGPFDEATPGRLRVSDDGSVA